MTDYTEKFNDFAAGSAAPPQYFSYNANYAGDINTPAASLPRGMTAVEAQLATTGQTLNRDVKVVKSWVTPRLPRSTRLTLPSFECISGDLEVTNLPSTDALNYGPYYTGPNPGTGGNFDPYTNVDGAYSASYSEVDISRLEFPLGFKVGYSALELGGCVGLGDFLSEHPEYQTGLMFVAGGGDPTPFLEIGNTFTGLTGIGISDLNAIVSCSTVTVNPPQDPCCVPCMGFVIKKGTKWPGDYSIIDLKTDCAIKNPTIKPELCGCATDENEEIFNEDWVFKTSEYVLAESTVFERYEDDGLPVIVLRPKTCLSLSFTVSSVLEFNPQGTLQETLVSLLQNGDFELYLPSGSGPGYYLTSDGFYPGYGEIIDSDGSDRNYELFGNKTVIPRGSSFPCGFTTDVGMKFPSSMVIPSGSSIIAPQYSDPAVNPRQVAQSRILLDYSIFAPGFVFAETYRFINIVPSSKELSYPPGSILSQPATLPLSSKWECLKISDADISGGHVLASDLRFNENQQITTDVYLSCGSIIVKGSILEEGTVTDEGMMSTKDLKFSAGTPITSPYLVCTPTTTCPGTNFLAGTIFKQGSSLPLGLEIPNGNVTPADISIPVTASVTINAGSELLSPILQPGFIWGQGTGFEPCSEIPSGSQISAGANIPVKTIFYAGSKFPFPFPLPLGVVFEPCSEIPAGTQFSSDIALPMIFAKPNMVFPVTGNLSDVPYTFINLGGKTYFVLKSGTVLTGGFTIYKGSVLLATTEMQALVPTGDNPAFSTGAYDGTWVTGAGELIFNETEYSFVSMGCGPSIETFTMNQGVPTMNTIHVNGQVVIPFDLAVPTNDSASIFKGVVFNVPFTTAVVSKPDQKYVILEDNSVYHPPNKEICTQLVLNTDFLVPSNFTLTRKITLPNAPTCYITSILADEGTFIKYPSTVQTTNKRFLVGSSGLEISSSGTKAGITLRRGNVINMQTDSYDGLVLPNVVVLQHEWKLLADLTNAASINASGYYLPAGAVLPAPLNIRACTELPAGLTPANPIQLAQDYVVTPESGRILIPKNSYIVCNSVFERGTSLATGFSALDVTYGPVDCWSAGTDIFLPAGVCVPSSLEYFYFGDTESLPVYTDVCEYNSLLLRLADLETKIKNLAMVVGRNA